MSNHAIKKAAKDRIILGIDPGTNVMGYGIIHIKGVQPHLLIMDALHLSPKKSHPDRLKTIFEFTLELIRTHHPDELAIEAPFFGKNVQSMLKLGRAQGVAMAACLYQSVPIFEYSPKKIKQSITGNGNASKEQVAAMLKSIFSLKSLPDNLDATDGLAAALCHHFQGDNPSGAAAKSSSGWAGFLKKNPDRLRNG
ncbi:MAG: crossover junction endodeoxyribonuclease RuvC [Flavobacteriales bacterium]|nr:crossover junction endodeoxyribonuclease RuvC [Flavobacteriales bacterium]